MREPEGESLEMNFHKIPVDLWDVESGIYYIRLQTEDTLESIKFIEK